MHTLKITALPGDLETIRKFAPRSDGLDLLPDSFTRLGFNGRAGVGDTITVDLNTLSVTPTRLPAGVTLVTEIVLKRPAATGNYSELFGLPVGTPVWVSAGAAAHAIQTGIADYA